jgi:hypothetical protein
MGTYGGVGSQTPIEQNMRACGKIWVHVLCYQPFYYRFNHGFDIHDA